MEQLTVKKFNDGVVQLAQSSRDLATRFGQVRTVAGQIALIREELEEVLTADSDAHRVGELCDLIVVTAGYADVIGESSSLRYPLWGDETISLGTLHYEVLDGFDVHKDYRRQYPVLNVMFLAYKYMNQNIPNAAELFPAQVSRVVAKNAAKSADTHELNPVTGKITRKVQS